MPDSSRRSDGWRPLRSQSVWPLVGFSAGFVALVLASNVLWTAFVGADASIATAPPLLYNGWGAASSALQFALAALVLRYEGVRLRDVGLAPRLLAPALAAGAVVVVALNAAVAVLGVGSGNALSLGFYPQYAAAYPEVSAGLLAVTGLHHYLFTGLAEELAFRGYVQNKLVALSGSRTVGARVSAVVVASLGFGVLHLPVAIFGTDASLAGIAFAVLLSGASGVAFGTIYELTRNLWLVAILHGFGDWWPLFVDAGGVAWPHWGVILVVYAVVVGAYRSWAKRSARTSLGTPAAAD